MRVVEPKQLIDRKVQLRRKQKLRQRLLAALVIALIVATSIVSWSYINRDLNTLSTVDVPKSATAGRTDTLKVKTVQKKFTANEFKELYHSIIYPNTQVLTVVPVITGNEQADANIRKIASSRGYMPVSIPMSPIIKTNEPMLKGSEEDLLQPLALAAWNDLKSAAQKENVRLSLISAYRSPKQQRELFLERLASQGASVATVASGRGDQAVDRTLHLTAIPGYSRHHTGYTVDIACQNSITVFKNSSCYKWLSTNNYENAKKYGWIPSYPEGADSQGPEPEAWEYVWVGVDLLYE